MRRIVVVGASLAGVSAIEELRYRGYDGDLILVGAEPHLPYDRPPLSKEVLAGARSEKDCLLRPQEWYVENRVDLILGSAAVGLDISARAVELAGGDRVDFDGLVIATGAAARELPSRPLAGVHTLRTIDDAQAIRAAIESGARLGVIGGGVIGCEVAASAVQLGAEVTIVEGLDAPMARVIGEELGTGCGFLHRDHGVNLRCGVAVSELRGERAVDGVVLADGTVVEADAVVVGIGARPCTDWLAGSGLPIGDGVLCDATCRTAAPGIVAAGDVARWEHPDLGSIRIEHWENAVTQAQAAVAALLEPGSAAPFAPVPYVWSDQYDVKIQIVGRPEKADEIVIDGDLTEGRFVAMFGHEGRLTAGVGFSRAASIRRIRALLGEGASLADAIEATGAPPVALGHGGGTRQISQRETI